ncbi:ABC-type multidrug transport system permease subunit [Peribacillus simplex]|uniref:hypothetical protein n=1 Tax=Peribacillus simplex TaxID=1478 RepID=UPI0024E26598|nr:hypothetical protein [Peribacillus simplex]MDF9763727.1 ABC-type multidrug transport system permease subunit [Peribacillus simplex]MDF9763742.1 ABC-type multidrug transport system permease subunit [Peribacillus simplex]
MDNKNSPWYLKNGWSTLFAIIFPPIAYIIIVFNLKKMDYDTKMNRLFFVTIVTSLWLLKFLPHNIFNTFIVIICFGISAFLLFYRLFGGEKNK